MEKQLSNLKLSNDLNNITPGSKIKEKNSSTEYTVIGYDYTFTNLICIESNNITFNIFNIIKKDNIDEITYQNKIPKKIRFRFE
jgi:hypothetical protein